MGLILPTLMVMGVVLVAASWWPLPGVFGKESGTLRSVSATVVESAPCGSSTPGDLLEMTVDGEKVRARYDGCGHGRGRQLRVRIPADPAGEFTALPAGSDEGDSGADLRARLSWVLVTLAGVAGGGYSLMLRRWIFDRPSA